MNHLTTALAIAPFLLSTPHANANGSETELPRVRHGTEIVDDVDPVAKAIGAISCVVVRPDGTISYSHVGLVEAEALEAAVAEALAGS